jgi:formate dehydrogenase
MSLACLPVMKIVAVLYPAGEIAKKTPELLGCAENALGLTDFLESQGHEFVVLTDKENELDKHLPSTSMYFRNTYWLKTSY